jgi:hypothetical protein
MAAASNCSRATFTRLLALENKFASNKLPRLALQSNCTSAYRQRVANRRQAAALARENLGTFHRNFRFCYEPGVKFIQHWESAS